MLNFTATLLNLQNRKWARGKGIIAPLTGLFSKKCISPNVFQFWTILDSRWFLLSDYKQDGGDMRNYKFLHEIIGENL